MRQDKLLCAAAAAAFAVCCLAGGGEAELKAKAKETLGKCKDAIVNVKLVVCTRYVFEGREENKQEHTSEVTGTVLDPSGLTVLSNYQCDPNAAMSAFSFDAGGEKMQYKAESDITDVKIVLSDGTEVPAQLVLKDKDLDLAFIKPKEKPAQPMACVTLAKPVAEPELLDDVFSIGRQGRVLNRVPSLHVGRVNALVKKPRTFYICDGAGELGTPVFNAKGETLGLSTIRILAARDAGGEMMAPVVLPAEDAMEVAKQAAAAKVVPKKEKGEPAKKEGGEEKK